MTGINSKNITAMKIYVVNVDLLENVSKPFNKLSNHEVIDLCEKDENREHHDVFNSIDELSAHWNTEEILYPSHSYMRVIKEEFPISCLSREDLEEKGFDTSNVDDATMERLASKMGDDYNEQMFWDVLPIHANYMDIPLREDDEDE